MAGPLESASRLDREMVTWSPRWGSPDQIVNQGKAIIDARSSDMAQDDGLSQAAITTHRDGIVGAKYTLNCKPDLRTLGAEGEDGWLDDFQGIVEARWNAVAESDECFLDAARRRTVTEMCRLAVSSFVLTGEVLAPAEWIRDADRPCRTAVHLISPARLSNPKGQGDYAYKSDEGRSLTAGIYKNFYGKHIAYSIRRSHPGDVTNRHLWDWDEVPAALPWGRKQMLYINEPLLVEQTRGLGDMAAALPHMRMGKKHSQVALQNAIVNATYAAAVESDLPPPEIAVAMGASSANGGTVTAAEVVDGWEQAIGTYLGMIGAYLNNAPNVQIDGAKMPVLPPGTKFKLMNAGNGGDNFQAFQQTIDRKTAASLGMSYEEYTRDYSQLSYSGGKMSNGKTERFQNARKAIIIDRFASGLFTLWLEEELANADSPVPLPPTWASRDDYYRPLMKQAISRCSWIGTGKGQIDELKETQAAMLRIKSGLSTWEAECARLGIPWEDVARQQAKERKLFQGLDLDFTMDAQKSTDGAGTQTTLEGNAND